MTIRIPWTDHTDKRGPCSTGFHIPTKDEFQMLLEFCRNLGIGFLANSISNIFHMPQCKVYDNQGQSTSSYIYAFRYWTSSADSDGWYQTYMRSIINYIVNIGVAKYANGWCIRPFRDTPIDPDITTWTKILENPQDGFWTLDGNDIIGRWLPSVRWNQSSGIISACLNNKAILTMADKNVGATTVYNYGDTLSQANCGNQFQWGNNYPFPYNSTVTTTTVSGEDLSWYGPGWYYSNGLWNTAWSDIQNYTNAWGWVTQGTKVIRKALDVQYQYLLSTSS